MKTSFRIILGLIIFTTIISSCSRKKNTFISRNYHALSARDNTLFNGFNALELGRETLNEGYFDNYWDILPIERMQITEEITLPGESRNENFTRAEEKAVKAIQKHGMNIKGREYNPQIDEAYLLLGKSRYFDQRFIPALESFNYILYKYPASNKINQAKVWREKVNIRLENEDLAIQNLKRLIEQEELEDQVLADATSMLAQAYINTKSLDSALTQIDIAANVTKSNDERGRYRFIQGQLYNALGDKDSANIAFNRVIDLNRSTPRMYLISAHIEKAKNFDYDDGNKLEFLELLTDLEKNRENRPYLDKIYHQIGEYYLKDNSDSLAVAFYNKSLRTDTQDRILKARTYEILGNMNFDKTVYAKAGAYYDSTMLNMVENSKPYRTIKRKRDNLEDVIYYQRIAKTNDSILNLLSLTDEERAMVFQEHIENLKIAAAKEKERAEFEKRNKGLETSKNSSLDKNKSSFTNTKTSKGGPGPPGQAVSSFYFYNQTTVAYGKNEFIKLWGDRKLEDNWRWSESAKSPISKEIKDPEIESATEEELYSTDFYEDLLPSDQRAIDSISKERNYAYYQLGLIYKEKFKEYQLSKSKFQELLDSNPEENLILPTKYNLYKLYELLGEVSEADIVKNDIITNYPDSRYATILSNPDAANIEDQNSPESIYKKMYAQFENQEYEKVLSEIDFYILAFEGEEILTKFELLKATVAGRLYGFEAYSNGISHVALTYANKPEGQQAQNIVTNVLPKLEFKEFASDTLIGNYKVLYIFDKDDVQEMTELVETLDEVVGKVAYYELKTSIDVYNPETSFVVVHGLKSINGAKGFAYILEDEDRVKITKPSIAISSKNYQIIQIHKNFDEYLSNHQ